MEVTSPFLERLSNELIHHVLTLLHPFDLFNVLGSCRTLRDFVNGNKLLHKEIYLQHYDDPSHIREPDWEAELHLNVKLEKILQSDDRDEKTRHLSFVSERVRSLLDSAKVPAEESRNVEWLNGYFSDADEDDRGIMNRDIFLCSSTLFEQGGSKHQSAAATPELRQASARLHCLYGRPIDPFPSLYSSYGAIRRSRNFLMEDDSPARNTRTQAPEATPVHAVARGKVYNLAEYTLPSLWGPFMEDGSHRTDWEKIEAIMVVLGFNLRKFNKRSDGRFPYVWEDRWLGATPRSFVSPPPSEEPEELDIFEQLAQDFADEEPRLLKQPDPSLESQDPYGVTGTWMRVVCFLDYNDLYNYNFNVTDEEEDQSLAGHLERRQELQGLAGHLGRRRPQPIDTEEGIITLTERLRVTKIEPASNDEQEDWDEKPDPDFSKFQGERLPIVHFTGDSRSLHASWDPNANSKIRGSVRQTPEGEIRWTTFSIFHGEERWRSEGIQVGGLRSARGVLGNWFDKDFDEHGPAGPTAFWKESDHVDDGVRSDGRVVAFF